MKAAASLAVFIVTSCWAQLGLAQRPQGITAAEFAATPVYCKDTIGFGSSDSSMPSAGARHWLSLMGKGFWGMHHYCWAIMNLNRAARPGTPEQQRNGLRQGAVRDIDYAIDAGIQGSGPNFIMLPELYLKRGQVLLLLKRDRDAFTSFERSMALKPDYWPPYVELAEFFRSRGDAGKALEYVAKGLAQTRDDRWLVALHPELQKRAAGLPRLLAPVPAKEPAAPATEAPAPEKDAKRPPE